MLNIDFVEHLTSADLLRYEKAVNWALRTPSFVQENRTAGDVLFENVFWLLGRSRLERVLYSSLFLYSEVGNRNSTDWYLKSVLDLNFFMKLPIPSEINLLDIIQSLNLKKSYVLNKDIPRYYPPLHRIMIPLGEEWTTFLAMAFKVGYPRVKEITGEPIFVSEVDVERARRVFTRMGQWAIAQGSYSPANDFFDASKISDKFIKYLWSWRKTLFRMYGFIAGENPAWVPTMASKLFLTKLNLDFGLPVKLNGSVNLRPKDIALAFLHNVERWKRRYQNGVHST